MLRHEKTKDGDLKHEIAQACPCGGVGDRLWAKEAHVLEHCVETGQLPPHDDGRPLPTRPEGDGDSPAWIQLHYRTTDAVPPSPTPTWRTRLPLAGAWWTADPTVGPELHARTSVEAYRRFWNRINGPGT